MTTPRPQYSYYSPTQYSGYAEGGPDDGNYFTSAFLTVHVSPTISSAGVGRYDFTPASELDFQIPEPPYPHSGPTNVVKGSWHWVSFTFPWGCEQQSNGMCKSSGNEGTICAARHKDALRYLEIKKELEARKAREEEINKSKKLLQFFQPKPSTPVVVTQPSEALDPTFNDPKNRPPLEDPPVISKFCGLRDQARPLK